MGRRRKNARGGRHAGEDEQRGSNSDADDDSDDIGGFDDPRASDPNTIEYKIVHAKHPFEKRKFIESKVVTPSQRAITCCIQTNGGWASEDVLLEFLQKNWGFIGKMNIKLPNNMPDTRILHINLAVKKKNLPLFVQDPAKPYMWTVNTSTDYSQISDKSRIILSRRSQETDQENDGEDSQKEPETLEEAYRKDKADSFEAHVFQTLKTYQDGTTLEQLAEATKQYEGQPGLFQLLTHIRRVRAVLIAKKSTNDVFEKNGIWSCYLNIPKPPETVRKESDFLPPCLRSVNITELTLDEFYNVLKQNRAN